MGKVLLYNDFCIFLKNRSLEIGVTDEDLRLSIKLDKRTWRKRKKNPTEFTLSHTFKLAKVLNIPFQDLALKTIQKSDQSLQIT